MNKDQEFELLRHALRGSNSPQTEADGWDTKFACEVFSGLREKKRKIKGFLGPDMKADFIAAQYKGPAAFRHLTAQFQMFIFCRPEVNLALAVVSLERGMKPSMLRGAVADIRQHLKDATRVEALQDRFPTMTDKRIGRAVAQLKL